MAQAPNNPDVRVKLSPEGVKEVIDALRKVRKEAQASDKDSAKVFSTFEGKLQSIRGLVPVLGFGAAAAGALALARSVANSADQMGKMATRVGTTAESLSVLTLASDLADVSQEQLQGGLGRLARALGDLREGTGESVDSFRELNLTAKDFEGLDTAQAFALVAQRIAGMDDGLEKTNIAMRIFGRAGANLITLLNDLGTRGFAAAEEEARRLGVIISSDLAKQSEIFNDNLTRLGGSVRGLAINLTGGLIERLAEATNAIVEARKESGLLYTAWVALGSIFPVIFGTGEIQKATEDVKRLQKEVSDTRKLIDKGRAPIPFTPFEVRFNEKAMNDLRKNLKRQEDELRKAQKRLEDLTKPKAPPKTSTTGITEAFDARREVAKLEKELSIDEIRTANEALNARVEFARQIVEAERGVADAKAAANAKTIDGQKRISEAERTLLNARLADIEAAYNKEVRLAQIKEQKLIEGLKSKGKLEAQETRIIDEIVRQSNASQLTAARARHAALLKLQTEQLDRARDAKNQIIAFDREVKDALEGSARARLGIVQANFTAEQQLDQKRLETVESESKLQEAALRGNTEEAKKRHAELVRLAEDFARLGGKGAEFMIDRADDLLKLAQASSKFRLNETAKEAQKAADEIGKILEPLEKKISELRAKAIDVKIGLNNESLQTMISEIQRELDRKVFQVQVLASISGNADGGFLQRAFGGPLPGYSPHPRADNLLFMGTAGEYITQIPAVRYWGTDFMNAVNSMDISGVMKRIPFYAEGGPLGLPRMDEGGSLNSESIGTLDLTAKGRNIGTVAGSRDTLRALVAHVTELSHGVNDD